MGVLVCDSDEVTVIVFVFDQQRLFDIIFFTSSALRIKYTDYEGGFFSEDLL